jgi:hypothetical protein
LFSVSSRTFIGRESLGGRRIGDFPAAIKYLVVQNRYRPLLDPKEIEEAERRRFSSTSVTAND